MHYTVDQIYDHIHQKVEEVYEVFKNFFGEEYVDLQKRSHEIVNPRIRILLGDWGIPETTESGALGYEVDEKTIQALVEGLGATYSTIYVWWPLVTVSNEYGKSIFIQDLYAQITLQMDGRIPYEKAGFLLNRATYTEDQFRSGYLHSHVNSIPKTDFTQFKQPCLGTGPIKETIVSLKNECDNITWMLFCKELSVYVTVESIAGVPYKKLEEVRRGGQDRGYQGLYPSDYSLREFSLPEEQMLDFIKYYLQKGHLILGFQKGHFCYSMPFYSYIIDVSNCFIDWYNQLPIAWRRALKGSIKPLLYKRCCAGGKIYRAPDSDSDTEDLSRYQGSLVLYFKGHKVALTIHPNKADEGKVSLLLTPAFASCIIKSILKVVNFRYENGYNHLKTSGEQRPSTTCKRVYYL